MASHGNTLRILRRRVRDRHGRRQQRTVDPSFGILGFARKPQAGSFYRLLVGPRKLGQRLA